jgi:hypothetical protein
VFDEIEEGLSMVAGWVPSQPNYGQLVYNWDPIQGRNVAETKGMCLVCAA